MSRRRFVALAAALLALNAFFWLAQGGFALPKAVIDRFFGPRMIRAEVIVEAPGGAINDVRLDRGVLTVVTRGSIELREQDGTVVTIPVAPRAKIVGSTTATSVSQLRPGQRVLVVRNANARARVIQVESQG